MPCALNCRRGEIAFTLAALPGILASRQATLNDEDCHRGSMLFVLTRHGETVYRNPQGHNQRKYCDSMQRLVPLKPLEIFQQIQPARAIRGFGFPALPQTNALVMISAGIVALVTLPLVYLLLRALGAGTEGVDYLLRPRTLTIVANSVLLVGAVTGTAVLVGVPFAWLTARTNLRGRRVWLVLGLLPMVIPSYIGALAYTEAFGPRGALQKLLEPLGVSELPSIYGFFGAWLTITLFTYPFVVLPVRAALLNSDPALEEAGRSLGLNRWQVFWRVTLPQLRPALAAGMLLTALYTLSDFGAVMVMRYNAFTRAIYVTYNSSFDRDRAAVLGLVLVLLTLVLVLFERRIAARTRNYRIGTCTPRKPQTMRLGTWQTPALLFCGLLVGLGVAIPLLVLGSWALNPNVTSSIPLALHTLVINTGGTSLLTALVVAAAALPLALLAVRGKSRWGRWMVNFAYVGNVLPGIVIGLALVFFVMNAAPGIYQTIPVLVLGYAIRFLPYSLAATRSALTQINPALEHAARSLGLHPWQVALRVTLPMAKAGILGGAALVFLNAMKELPTTLMLAPIGFRTLATRIWTAQESGTLALIGTPGLVLLFVSCLSLVLLLWRDHRAQG